MPLPPANVFKELAFKELDFKELAFKELAFKERDFKELTFKELDVFGYSDLLGLGVFGYFDLLGMGRLFRSIGIGPATPIYWDWADYSDLLGLGVPKETIRRSGTWYLNYGT